LVGGSRIIRYLLFVAHGKLVSNVHESNRVLEPETTGSMRRQMQKYQILVSFSKDIKYLHIWPLYFLACRIGGEDYLDRCGAVNPVLIANPSLLASLPRDMILERKCGRSTSSI
jgi:hypothetical protein